MNKLMRTLVGAVALGVTQVASAGMISLDGVDFTSSWLDADTLRIEIDAANPTGGWTDAYAIDSIAINGEDANGITAWSWVNISDITLDANGFDPVMDGTGLAAGGCKPLELGKNHQCWEGLADLADNMYFDFTFSGDAVISSYTDSPHLKVRFIDEGGEKVGDLLSENLGSPTTQVPEPSSIAMLAIGVLGLFVARRRSYQ